MADLAGFDANNVPESDFSALPEGKYVVIATASEEKVTKAGTGKYLQITFEVLDGAHKGRKIWARLNLWNPNPQAVIIAQRELRALCLAVGIPRPNDSAELHNKPLVMTLGVELDDRKRETNRIDNYEPLNVGGAPAAAAPIPQPSAPAPAAAPASMPWART